MSLNRRREFLADVGRGMLVASVGSALAQDLGLATMALADEAPTRLTFGALEPLVTLMEETSADRLLPIAVERMKSGTDLRELVSAAALANARAFGGQDYDGYHALMALLPSYQMSRELPEAERALPVLKVIYRNTNHIQGVGARSHEAIHALEAAPPAGAGPGAEGLREAERKQDMDGAERIFAAMAAGPLDDAYNNLQYLVQDNTNVHRVVLAWRAWAMLDLTGKEHAHTLLRQSVRFCVDEEANLRRYGSAGPLRALLPRLLDDQRLMSRATDKRQPDDAWIERMAHTIYASSREKAASEVAAALADGIAIEGVGEAISLAANQLVLRDHGRTPQMEIAGKPIGSVHGDSIGVHACDSANAWRNLARVANARNTFACLILGAYQVALDRVNRGGDFLNWQPLPLKQHVAGVRTEDAAALLAEAEAAIRGNLQAHAAAIVERYGQLGHAPRPLFDLMLKYAISEDGSLHGEKYYRTTSEEFATTRPAFRWRQLVALARVTASEYGRPAPGMADARALLKV